MLSPKRTHQISSTQSLVLPYMNQLVYQHACAEFPPAVYRMKTHISKAPLRTPDKGPGIHTHQIQSNMSLKIRRYQSPLRPSQWTGIPLNPLRQGFVKYKNSTQFHQPNPHLQPPPTGKRRYLPPPPQKFLHPPPPAAQIKPPPTIYRSPLFHLLKPYRLHRLYPAHQIRRQQQEEQGDSHSQQIQAQHGEEIEFDRSHGEVVISF